MKNSITFVLSSQRTILRVFVCVAFLFAANTALYAAQYRLSISNGCCAQKPVIVLCKTERDSLSPFKYFNFSFMQRTMKNASQVNNSTLSARNANETSDNQNEIWKDIAGYEGLYQVSNLGRIKGCERYAFNPCYGKQFIREKQLKLNISTTGYFYVYLCKNGIPKRFKVHRLVAIAFIPNQENKPIIDHINGIPTDNRVENLRWATQTENMNNPVFIKRTSDAHSKPVIQTDMDGNIINHFPSLTEAQRITKINRSSIYRCCYNKYKQAGGFIWKYQK